MDMAPFDHSMGGSATDKPRHAHPSHFKEVLARLAGGLAIISFWDLDRPAGLLVSSITGLSIDPPRFLFCVQKTASCHDALLRARDCGVAILSSNEDQEAQTFIDPMRRAERFLNDRWRLTGPGPPLFKGALSSSSCSISGAIDGGSHTILIVTADAVEVNEGDPLLSFNRSIRALGLPA